MQGLDAILSMSTFATCLCTSALAAVPKCPVDEAWELFANSTAECEAWSPDPSVRTGEDRDFDRPTGGSADSADGHLSHSAEQGQKCAASILLHCLFAMVFAAATLGILSCLGLMSSPVSCHESLAFYGMCEVWQDSRCLLSFALGACTCCGLTLEGQPADRVRRLQLHNCLL